MNQHLVHITIVVDDYDIAIRHYTGQLGFELLEDTILSPTKRWVLVKPRGRGTCALLLAVAANEEQKSRIGNQTGGRVFLFLHTDNLQRDYERFRTNGINFITEPRTESYGTVAVFEDLYGNRWDLVEPLQRT